jgi:hypothetical protein
MSGIYDGAEIAAVSAIKLAAAEWHDDTPPPRGDSPRQDT